MPKVPKQKVKIKKGQTIHPNSRKASALHRENNKSEHRLKMKGDRRDKDKHIWEKVRLKIFIENLTLFLGGS